MSKEKVFLEKIHIKNFLSLRDVELPLKPLTVLVGPNASGKSNILNALKLLSRNDDSEKLPSVKSIRSNSLGRWRQTRSLSIESQSRRNPKLYELNLKADADHPFDAEELLVNDL